MNLLSMPCMLGCSGSGGHVLPPPTVSSLTLMAPVNIVLDDLCTRPCETRHDVNVSFMEHCDVKPVMPYLLRRASSIVGFARCVIPYEASLSMLPTSASMKNPPCAPRLSNVFQDASARSVVSLNVECFVCKTFPHNVCRHNLLFDIVGIVPWRVARMYPCRVCSSLLQSWLCRCLPIVFAMHW
jgi:hypothetical protein